VWEVKTGKAVAAYQRDPDNSHIGFADPILEWSPNGRRLAAGRKKMNSRLRVMDLDRGTDHFVPINPDFFAWSPDSRYLALNTQNVKIWDVEENHEAGKLPVINTWQNPVAWSPDGKELAVGGFPFREIHVIQIETGKEIIKLGKPPGGVQWASFAFSP